MKKTLLLLIFISQILFGAETDKIFSIVKKGNIEEVKTILKETANVNIVDEYGMSLLNHAILKNNIEVVRELINSGADVNRKGNQGFLEIEIAIHFDNLEMLEILVENNADINALDEHGQSPLVYSVIAKANKCFDYLMSLGAKTQVIPNGSESLLEFAAKEVGNAYVVKKLLDMGVSPNIDTFNGDNLLIESLEKGYIEVSKLLIDYGFNLISDNGRNVPSALYYIIDNEFLDLQKLAFDKYPHLLFVEHKENDDYDFSKNEQYSCKVLRKNKALFIELLDKFPEIAEMENFEGQNAMLYAAASGDYDLVQQLISKGINFSNRDFGGNTALMLAARSGNSELTEFFIKKGLDVNAKNNKGETALMLSAKSVQPKFVGIISIESDNFGYTKLMQLDRKLITLYSGETWDFASYIASLANCNIKLREDDFFENFEDETRVCEVLIKNGARLEEKSNEIGTALNYAIIYEDSDLIKYFINKGADVNNPDIKGLTPLDYAIFYADISTIEELLNNGGYFGLDKTYGCNPMALINRSTTTGHDDLYNPTEVLEILKMLIKNGYNPNKKSPFRWLPIHIFSMNDANLEIVKLLYLNKADVNAKIVGKTPLSFAVETNSIEIVKFLVNKGADLKFKTTEGKSLLSLTDNSELIKYLKTKGVK